MIYEECQYMMGLEDYHYSYRNYENRRFSCSICGEIVVTGKRWGYYQDKLVDLMTDVWYSDDID